MPRPTPGEAVHPHGERRNAHTLAQALHEMERQPFVEPRPTSLVMTMNTKTVIPAFAAALLAVAAMGHAHASGSHALQAYSVPAGATVYAANDIDATNVDIQGTLVYTGSGEFLINADSITLGSSAIIQGSHGTDGATVVDYDAVGLAGDGGNAVHLKADSIKFSDQAVVAGGMGCDGGDAIGSHSSKGGNGGSGGAVIFDVPTATVAILDIAYPGSGGNGGDAYTSSIGLTAAGLLGSSSPIKLGPSLAIAGQGPSSGGRGGNSGLMILNGFTQAPSSDYDDSKASPACTLGVLRDLGEGGHGGNVTVVSTAGAGADGGDGTSGFWTCTDGAAGSIGGTAPAPGAVTGGFGGTGYNRGGDGGWARSDAFAGDGGNGGDGGWRVWGANCNGGAGGNGGSATGGTATGGKGGDAICGTGGNGGDAFSTGHGGSGGQGGNGGVTGVAGAAGAGTGGQTTGGAAGNGPGVC